MPSSFARKTRSHISTVINVKRYCTMKCNHCGTELQAGEGFCHCCGKAVEPEKKTALRLLKHIDRSRSRYLREMRQCSRFIVGTAGSAGGSGAPEIGIGASARVGRKSRPESAYGKAGPCRAGGRQRQLDREISAQVFAQ